MSGRKPIKYYSAKRRAIYAAGETIVALEVFERDAWLCVICGNAVDRAVRYPNIWCATIEHLVPLSRGGTHTWDNCFTAHLFCNLRKGDNLLDETAAC